MYTLATFLQALAALAMIALAFVIFWPVLVKQIHKNRVGKTSRYEAEGEEIEDTREASRQSLRFLGLPSIHAGHFILNVPCFDPERTGEWIQRRMVYTASRIMAYLKQGPVPGDLVELDGSYALFGTNGRTFLIQAHNLTTREEDYLEKQRNDAVYRGDGVIEEFQGVQWKIGTACGAHNTGQGGGKNQSTIQVLSQHPELGKNGVLSCLPPNLLDGAEHTYFDMRAREMNGTRVLFFFYAGGRWSCFMGRELNETERTGLQAL